MVTGRPRSPIFTVALGTEEKETDEVSRRVVVLDDRSGRSGVHGSGGWTGDVTTGVRCRSRRIDPRDLEQNEGV